MTVMNPKLDPYFLYGLHGQFFDFHSLIPFLKAVLIPSTLKV